MDLQHLAQFSGGFSTWMEMDDMAPWVRTP